MLKTLRTFFGQVIKLLKHATQHFFTTYPHFAHTSVDNLNDLLKNGKRKHGSTKIPKEIWVQAALELFQAMPVDWESIEDEEQLQSSLKNLDIFEG